MFERCLFFNVNALARRVNKIWEQAFHEFELSPAHAYLVRLVLDQPGISQKQVVDELRLEKSTVTRFVDALEARQLLRRERQGRDVLVFPTRGSKALQAKLEKTGDALFQTMLSTLGNKEMQELVSKLRQAYDKLA